MHDYRVEILHRTAGWDGCPCTWSATTGRPLALGEERRFVLAVGFTPSLPTFRVRIVCRAGDDGWEWSEPLDSPRSGPSLW